MELVYLWVEDYKNIHKQGFNFSPKFECKFKDEYDQEGNLKANCELVICDKKKNGCKDNDYIENFFSDNINVTAIVGKNGSGKSSILEILNGITNDQSDVTLKCKYLLLFDNGGYTTNIDENKIFDKNNFLKNEVTYRDIYTLNYVSETSSEKKRLERNIDISAYNVLELLRVIHTHRINMDNSNIFMYKPKFIELKVFNTNQLLEKVKIKSIEDNNIELESLNYFIDEIKKSNDQKWKTFVLSKVLTDGLSFLNNIQFNDLYDWVLKDFYDNARDEFETEYKKFNDNLTTLSKISFINTSDEQWEFLIFYKESLIYDFTDEHGRKYSDLSHGEKTVFSVFLHITRIIDDYIGRKNCLALFDEMDIPLHPSWQKSLLKSIFETYANKRNNIHFILTTHSPFLLSDIPKETIIFLDTYKDDNGEQKEGNCKVLKAEEVLQKKETFGANIHTLLSDSFFMEDGLMGEFAKSKIEKVIKLLKPKSELSKKNQKFCEDIISIIGEPVLKTTLQTMLDDKKYGIETKLDKLKRQQKEIDEAIKKEERKGKSDEKS